MKVTVAMTTYNHARHISNAIEGVLRQETDFEWEFLIGEDDSADGTREIVMRYAAQHPRRIRTFYHKRSDVLYVRGRATGRRNLMNNLREASGQYIAICEGDDEWTDSLKLQKQVEYMDAHNETTVCFHRVAIIDEHGARLNRSLPERDVVESTELSDLIVQNYIPMCSVMYRRVLKEEMPAWFYGVLTADWALHMLHAAHGKIGFIDSEMASYRVHSSGIWSTMTHADALAEEIHLLECVRSYFGEHYHGIVDKSIARRRLAVSRLALEARDPMRAARMLLGAAKGLVASLREV